MNLMALMASLRVLRIALRLFRTGKRRDLCSVGSSAGHGLLFVVSLHNGIQRYGSLGCDG
jgi:hypothetical protein